MAGNHHHAMTIFFPMCLVLRPEGESGVLTCLPLALPDLCSSLCHSLSLHTHAPLLLSCAWHWLPSSLLQWHYTGQSSPLLEILALISALQNTTPGDFSTQKDKFLVHCTVHSSILLFQLSSPTKILASQSQNHM